MAKRLQEAEDEIAELRTKDTRESSVAVGTQPPQHLSSSFSQVAPQLETPRTSAGTFSIIQENAGVQPVVKQPVADISFDENGEIRYYGPTSAVHDPPQKDSPNSQISSSYSDFSSKAEARLALAAQSRESATWEEFALGNASLQTGIPRAMMTRLLHMHWTWVSPMFMWIYRPTFIRK